MVDCYKLSIRKGSKGVAPSQINSLRELLSQHDAVRVKLASDKLDAISISNSFSEDAEISSISELLEVRRRGILFQRKKAVN